MLSDDISIGHVQGKARSIENWVRGFKYISARNKEEFDSGLNEFMTTESDRPIFFEVFMGAPRGKRRTVGADERMSASVMPSESV